MHFFFGGFACTLRLYIEMVNLGNTLIMRDVCVARKSYFLFYCLYTFTNSKICFYYSVLNIFLHLREILNNILECDASLESERIFGNFKKHFIRTLNRDLNQKKVVLSFTRWFSMFYFNRFIRREEIQIIGRFLEISFVLNHNIFT